MQLSVPEPPPYPITEADFERIRRSWALPRSRGELPHLHVKGAIYFVTFRLLDAVRLITGAHASSPPSAGAVVQASSLPASMSQEPDDIAERSEPPLSAGSCVLAKPEVARVVAHALRHFEQQRYTLHAWCIMPNHVHVVVAPWSEESLSEILHSWKSYTATRINRLLKRSGPFWERESFDHFIRNLRSFERFVRYTVHNPVVAGFCA